MLGNRIDLRPCTYIQERLLPNNDPKSQPPQRRVGARDEWVESPQVN